MTYAIRNKALRNSAQILFAMAMLVELSGCATSADPTAMTVAAPQATEKPFPQRLQHAMCVRTVAGGTETNPLWVSKVDNKGFQAALSSSMDSAGLTAPSSSCSYPIDVNLLGLSQPSAGFDMTVTSHVNYKVYDASGQPYLLETIDTPYTATVSDAFVGVERLKIANEGAIRMSIQKFFNKLRENETK